MLGKMRGDRLAVVSSGSLPIETVLEKGVRGAPDIGALASGEDGKVQVLVWNYHDDDVPAPEEAIDLRIDGLPAGTTEVTVRHWRMDEMHSNAFTAWKKMGSPQNPTPEAHARLEAAGRLEELGPPVRIPVEGRSASVRFSLPRQGVSLVEFDAGGGGRH
jgi:xylan 1,4-beta-xylosidase